jgi:hypothetical protein
MTGLVARPTRMLAVLGFGEIVTADPDEFSRNRSSFYADPVAWLMTAVVGQAIERTAEPITGTAGSGGDEVGVLMISDICSLATMHSVRASTERGRVSPLRFAGANPGGLASLPCIEWSLRGPTLTLAMPPVTGLPAATVLAESWLAGGQASHVVLGVHFRVGGADAPRHVGRCAILGRAAGSETSTDALPEMLVGPVVPA